MISQFLPGSPSGFLPLLVEFAASALLVFWLATKLTRYADALERQTHISALWIGALFLAIVTSLPEAVVTIGASVMEGTLDLGAANLAGSNIFNLVIIVLLDALSGGGALHAALDPRLRRPAVSGMIMMALVVTAIVLHRLPLAAASGAWVGLGLSGLILVLYVVALVRSGEGLEPDEEEVTAAQVVVPTGHAMPAATPRTIIGRLVFYAAMLVVVSVWLLKVCDGLATTPFPFAGREVVLGRTVTGSFLLSAATSFPELFVCIVALRLGQVNMAVANVLGSNMVNMCFVPVMHLVSRQRFFYGRIEPAGVLVLLAAAVAMTLFFLAGTATRTSNGILRIGWASWCMLLVYVGAVVLVLRFGLQL